MVSLAIPLLRRLRFLVIEHFGLPGCESAYYSRAGDGGMANWNDILQLGFEYAIDTV